MLRTTLVASEIDGKPAKPQMQKCASEPNHFLLGQATLVIFIKRSPKTKETNKSSNLTVKQATQDGNFYPKTYMKQEEKKRQEWAVK